MIEQRWKPTYGDILQAVARGWCHETTSKKIVDPILGEAIAKEICKLIDIPMADEDE